MALINIFKKKADKTKAGLKGPVFSPRKKEFQTKIKQEKPSEMSRPQKDKEEKVKISSSKKRANFQSSAWRVLQSGHITEKASFQAESGKYIFRVAKAANKNEIKKAIESLYQVKVNKVNLIQLPKKKKRRGRVEGFKAGQRKVIATLAKGQTIDLLPR
ncbi:50S ribosomal protein L23 [Candidatus Gribaldobacteria bacterium]|nr:50S ribosomal protein L23 [Candidatus Gribaldobacteria bacterium]